MDVQETIHETVAELDKTAAGRKEIKKATERAMERVLTGESKAVEGLAKAQAEGTVYDGTASDGKGTRKQPKYRQGQQLKIKSNTSGLNDGGMEGCRVTPHGTPYIDPDGEVRQSCRTETGEIVGIPESALEPDRKPTRVASMSMSALGNAYDRIFGEPQKLSQEYCGEGCDKHGTKHRLQTHKDNGDPACT
jgi:hypothetical protein